MLALQMKTLRSLFGRNPNHDYYILKHCDDQEGQTESLRETLQMPLRLHWKLFLAVALTLSVIFGLYISTRATSSGEKYVTNSYQSQHKIESEVIFKESVSNCHGPSCNVNARSKDDEYAAYFVQAKKKINPFYHSFLKDCRTLCRDGSHPFLVILVPTLPSHSKERNAIRSTWASVVKTKKWSTKKLTVDVKVVFLLGIFQNNTIDDRVEKENRIFRDIIQGDFLDVYNNLAIKMLFGLRWVSLYCHDVKFILKADDDMFVNVPLLLETLEEYVSKISHNGIILGNINADAKVKRLGKWSVSEEVYPFPHYPPYAYGNTYVISGNIASRLFSTSEYMPYIPVEDAYITGILAKTIEAEIYNVPGFAYWLEHKPSFCDFVKDRKISATKVTVNNMYYIWDKLHSKDVQC